MENKKFYFKLSKDFFWFCHIYFSLNQVIICHVNETSVSCVFLCDFSLFLDLGQVICPLKRQKMSSIVYAFYCLVCETDGPKTKISLKKVSHSVFASHQPPEHLCKIWSLMLFKRLLVEQKSAKTSAQMMHTRLAISTSRGTIKQHVGHEGAHVAVRDCRLEKNDSTDCLLTQLFNAKAESHVMVFWCTKHHSLCCIFYQQSTLLFFLTATDLSLTFTT